MNKEMVAQGLEWERNHPKRAEKFKRFAEEMLQYDDFSEEELVEMFEAEELVECDL